MSRSLQIIRSKLSSKLFDINIFEIPYGSHFRVLKLPNNFYKEILDNIKTVKNKITLSALYFGTSPTESKIINELDIALSDKSRPDLKVKIILDYSRAKRLTKFNKNVSSSIAALSYLVNKYESRCQIMLYRMPKLTNNYYSAIIPKFLSSYINFNFYEDIIKYFPSEMIETIGVYHCKFCIFDNTVIITGANLSEEYFVNRQDRYMVITGDNSNELSKFLYDFVSNIESHCYELINNQVIKEPSIVDNKILNEKLNNLCQPKITESHDFNASTILYPLIQLNTIGIHNELTGLSYLFAILRDAEVKSLIFSSPYPSYTKNLIDNLKTYKSLKFIYPSQSSHGFSKGYGVKSIIPLMHMTAFYDSIKYLYKCTRNITNIQLYSFSKPNWTFHSKGIWIERNDSLIDITYIGSSNLGERSWKRDFELGFILTTTNESLQKDLFLEFKETIDNCKEIIVSNHFSTEIKSNTYLKNKFISFLTFFFRSYL